MRHIVVVLLSLWGMSASAEDLYLPLDNPVVITCHFCGYRYGNGACHNAIDFDTTDTNTPVYAAADGTVEKAEDGWNSGREACLKGHPYGNYILLRHNDGYTTRYAHLKKDSISVRVGERINAGQQIAIADNSGCSSGSHVHLEVRDQNNRPVDPYNNPADQNMCLVPNIPHTCGPNALWATCPPEPYTECSPTAEQCNGRDDDCDGQTDEDWPLLGVACSVGQGECRRSATWACAPGQRSIVCDTDPGRPQTETCNLLDDDCDGVTDNGSNLCAESGATCTNGTCLECNPPGPDCGAQGNCAASVYNTSRELVVSMFNRSPEQCAQSTFTYIEQGYRVPSWAQCNSDRIQWREYLTRNATGQSVSANMTFTACLNGDGRLCGEAQGTAAFSSGFCTDMFASVYENGHACQCR